MSHQSILQKIIYFPLTKMVAGIAVVVGLAALGEWLRALVVDKWPLPQDAKNGIVALFQITAVLAGYIVLHRVYEKRKVSELAAAGLIQYAAAGFGMGLLLQSLVVTVIYMAGGYAVVQVNPLSFLWPGFINAATAGFVAEILLVGVVFRMLEEMAGTILTLLLFMLLFAVMHAGASGASVWSVTATAVQAGLLLPLMYVYTRRLWLSIFFHFAWDFAEPGIYGGINPGIGVDKSLFTSNITGPGLLTGGLQGPGNSIQAAVFCLLAAILFLWLAWRKNNFIQPLWRK
jgi:membrane protease YdiL (CAAX protease family)